MGCCTGSTFTPSPDAALDPLQRVNYAAGMVLGADDFRQEQTYLTARDERALRETIGYGVISGLGVSAPKPATAGEGQQVRVAPGLALMPEGHLVGVPTEQCANLQAWLEAEGVRDATTAARTTVYVLLRYAQAGGSPVPLPDEPCAYSRVLDSFSLDFSWTPPDASEDLAVRAVVAWIRGIRIGPAVPAGQTLASFQADVERGLKEAVRAAWSDTRSPSPAMPAAQTPPLPRPSRVNLPAPPKELQIPSADVPAYYAAAFEVWTRLVRAGFMAHHGPAPAAQASAERALLLAAVDIKAGAGGVRAVRMLGRPHLLHLRLLQEWMLSDGSAQASGAIVGAALPKPVGASPNILVDRTGAAPDTRLDTVQDIGPGASPDFAGLSLSGQLSVGGQVQVSGKATVDGQLVLGQPLNGLLATDDKGVVIAARPWDGDEAALAAGKPPRFVYAPGQKAPLRIEDGGTGLGARPGEMQVLIGVKGATARGGDYALARWVNGSNTQVRLKSAAGGLELSIDAATGGGTATQVVAAGNAANPASLTAVSNANVVTLNTVQALHTNAVPRFQALSLSALPRRATPALVGWDAASGELVQTAAPQPAAVDVGQWGVRYANKVTDLSVTDKDHVLVVNLNGSLSLPNLAAGGISEGRVIVIKTVGGVTELVLIGADGSARQVIKAPQSITVIAATRLNPPQWLVIART